ncbi:integral membrane protein-like protein [Venturia nashicola]|nr:integral membrane protein-like protein [Venturia nashicola]
MPFLTHSPLPLPTSRPAAEETGSDTLSPLPPLLQVGLIPVALLGFLSAVSSVALLSILTWRMWSWNRRAYSMNQFVFLIYNLILSDIQQAFGFMLSAHWLLQDSIDVGTGTCWAQGWLLSTGDFGSGVWSFAIGLHTFAVVIFGFKLGSKCFAACVVLCWVLTYGLAVVPVALHPGIFVRAGSWCWLNVKYQPIRIWLHYAWIFFFEIGIVAVYLTTIYALGRRIKKNFYRSAERTRNARDAAYLMTFYPIIYVVCTLPLAMLRTFSMVHPDVKIHGAWYCFAGAMTTSNGWCDVLLYSLTRRLALFSGEPPMDNGIETFLIPWKKDHFGTETTCVHVPDPPSRSHARAYDDASQERSLMKEQSHRSQGNESLEFVQIKEKVTVEVKSEPMTNAQLRHMRDMKNGLVSMDGGSTLRRNINSKDTNSDSASVQQLWPSSISHTSSHEDNSFFAKSTNGSLGQRQVNETPQSERNNSGIHGVDSMDFQTRARGF